MWTLKKWDKGTYLQNRNRLRDAENKLMATEREDGGIIPTQGSNLGLLHCRKMLYHLSHQGSPNRYTVLYIKYINNKDLLYSTRNCIWYPVIAYNEQEDEKEYIYSVIYICIYYWGLLRWLSGKRICLPRDLVWSLSWENHPGKGNGNSLQYSWLGNPIDRGGWCV